MSFNVKPQRCPHCGGRCNAAVDPDNPLRDTHKPDELGVCFHCLTALTLGSDGILQVAELAPGRYTAEELFRLLVTQRTMLQRRRIARHARN